MKHLILILPLAACLFAFSANAGEKKLTEYIVQDGDTCWSIAQKIFGDGEKYRLIHRYNDLGPLPHILTPGTVLKLPIAGKSALGKVYWLRREVEAKEPSAFDWREAETDMPLWRLYRVRTGDKSSAGIEFEDSSHLKMREHALLVLYGSGATKSRLTRRVKSSVTLEKGSIRGGLAQLDREAAMSVKTAAGRVELQSRDSQIEVDDKAVTAVSVFDGKAKVSAKGEAVTVLEGEGTTVEKGKRPAQPTRLPTPPKWENDTDDRIIATPPNSLGRFRLAWTSVKGAAKYRFELSEDDAFRRVVVDADVGIGVRGFEARDLKPGTYFARVSTVDKRNLQSRASHVARVRIVALESSRSLEMSEQGILETVGIVRLNFPADLDARVEIAVNDGPYQSADKPIFLSSPGRHEIHFRLAGRTESNTLTVRVLKTSATLHLPDLPWTSTEPMPIRISLSDEQGRPAALPGLKLTTSSGKSLTLHPAGAGSFTAELLPEQKAVTLRAGWLGGDLTEAAIAFEAPPDNTTVSKTRTQPPPYIWGYEPPALIFSGPAGNIEARGARPLSRVGLRLNTSRAPERIVDEPMYFRAVLAGQTAFLRNRLGIDAELGFFDIPLDADLPGKTVLDPLKLGIRGAALLSRTFALTPSFRVSIPTGNREDIETQFVFEPGVLFDWAALEILHLGSNQVFVARTGEGPSILEYAGELDGEIRPLRWFGLAASFAWLVRPAGQSARDDDIDGAALLAGGALRFYLDRFRLSVQGSGAANGTGRRRFGPYSVGVNIDVGLKGK